VFIKREEDFFGGTRKGKALDLSVEGGPVRPYKLEMSPHIPKAVLDRGVKDLLANPLWFPGFCSNQEEMEWETAIKFTDAMSNRNSLDNAPKGPTNDPGDEIPARRVAQPERPIVVSEGARTTGSTPATLTPAIGTTLGIEPGIVAGAAVRFVSDGTEYIGTFKDTFDGGKKANILLDPDLQNSEVAKANVIGLRVNFPAAENANLAVAGVAVGDVQPII